MLIAGTALARFVASSAGGEVPITTPEARLKEGPAILGALPIWRTVGDLLSRLSSLTDEHIDLRDIEL